MTASLINCLALFEIQEEEKTNKSLKITTICPNMKIELVDRQLVFTRMSYCYFVV